MSAELLLLVCAANVCRSPLAELLLRRELDGLSEVRVESAGVGASGGARICELVAERHADAPWVRAAQEHRSRSLTPELLASAALVLVADREVRSEVVRMSCATASSPSAMPRSSSTASRSRSPRGGSAECPEWGST